MGKAPASQFYWGDLKRDVEYHLMSFEARGIWVEMLTCMWDSKERGKLTGTIDQISVLLGCPKDRFISSVLEIFMTRTGEVIFSCNANVTLLANCGNPEIQDLKTFYNNKNINELSTEEKHKIAQALQNCNGNDFVTVINRRMWREEKSRKLTYSRVVKHREKYLKRPCNENVTLPSSSSSSLNNNKGKSSSDVTLIKYYKNDQGNFVCSLCSKSFMQWKNLQDHFKEHKEAEKHG